MTSYELRITSSVATLWQSFYSPVVLRPLTKSIITEQFKNK